MAIISCRLCVTGTWDRAHKSVESSCFRVCVSAYAFAWHFLRMGCVWFSCKSKGNISLSSGFFVKRLHYIDPLAFKCIIALNCFLYLCFFRHILCLIVCSMKVITRHGQKDFIFGIRRSGFE